MKSTSIIFLHGFPFNASSWDDQVRYFQARYDVFAPDLRGHGLAEAPFGPWMIRHFADDLKVMMDAKKMGRAIICGLSMGGYVALQFATRYRERVAGLILADTRADADSNEMKDKRFDTIEKLHHGDMDAFAKEFAKSVLSEAGFRDRADIRARVEDMIRGNAPRNLAMAVGALASRHDMRPELSSIRCPTAVFVGADDKLTPPELSEVIASGIQDAELRIIAGAGHLSNIEQPTSFNNYLEEFLENNFADNRWSAEAAP